MCLHVVRAQIGKTLLLHDYEQGGRITPREHLGRPGHRIGRLGISTSIPSSDCTASLCLHSNLASPRSLRRMMPNSRLSGVVYVLSQFVMSVMVLLCWSSNHDMPYIYALKFTELISLNVWSISSVAIAVLITKITKVGYVELLNLTVSVI